MAKRLAEISLRLTRSIRDAIGMLPRLSEGRYLVWLILLLGCMYLGNLAYLDLAGGDETRVAGISREMAVSGDYLLPRLNGEAFLEYPPLYYIGTALSLTVFGNNSFGAKLPSALAAISGALLLFWLVRKMTGSAPTAFFSALILASSAQYFGNGTSCMVDSLLAMFCLLSWWGFYRLAVERDREWRRPFLLLAGGLAGGLLTKNLPGLAIPVSGMGVFLLLEDIRLRRWSYSRYLLLGSAVLLAAAVYAAYVLLLVKHYEIGDEWMVYTLVVKNNFGRFTGSYAEHGESFFYYFGKLPELFQPWLVVLLAALPFHWREVRRRHSVQSLYGLCILLTPFLLLCLSSGKRQVYLLPLAAPAAILSGTFLFALFRGEVIRLTEKIRLEIGKIMVIGVIVAGVLASAGLSVWGIVSSLPCWERYWSPAVLLAVTLLATWSFYRCRTTVLLSSLALTFALIYSSICGIGLASGSEKDSFEPMFAAVERQLDSGEHFYLDKPSERISGAAYFYLGRQVPKVRFSRIGLARLAAHDLVLTTERRWEQLKLSTEDWQVQRFNEKYILLEKKESI